MDRTDYTHAYPTSRSNCCGLCCITNGRRHTPMCNDAQATVTYNVIGNTTDSTRAEPQAVELSRRDRKDLEMALKQINQIKTFRTAAQQPYVKTIDSKGDVEMMFCDTGNNTASVMALDRYLVKQKNNPGRFTEVTWYTKEVGVQGIDKGNKQIAMVGAVGQTLYEPGTRRPLKIWTQLVKNCDTGAADLMLGSKIMRKAEWDAEVDI